MANHVLIQKIQLSQSTASVTFANIPPTGYTDLKLFISSRQTVANSSAGYYYDITFNNTSSNRSGRYLEGANGTTVFSATYTPWGLSTPSDFTANTFSNNEIYIPNYAGSNYKSLSSDAVNENNASAGRLDLIAGLWSDTAAINSITLTPGGGSFVANSTFSLYGIAATGTSPSSGPKASGGNTITTDGTYWYHAFLTSGTFTPIQSLSCDTLIVAGGGGGGGTGNGIAGGGGAGGLRGLTSQSFVGSTAYTVSVGAGGVGGLSAGTYHGTNGGNSSIIGGALSLSATGGGAGGANNASTNLTGQAGGSGGGGSAGFTFGAGNAGGYSPVEGFRGGTGVTNLNSAGGGGGAGGVGAESNATRSSGGGAGGVGLNTITGYGSFSATATATKTGASGYYAGGGSGGGYYDGATVAGGAGGGGTGGGGNGSANLPSSAGTTNTGGGGGGAGNYGAFGTVYPGAAGGSGIVIVRYAV
jgi:hypothetical protein